MAGDLLPCDPCPARRGGDLLPAQPYLPLFPYVDVGSSYCDGCTQDTEKRKTSNSSMFPSGKSVEPCFVCAYYFAVVEAPYLMSFVPISTYDKFLDIFPLHGKIDIRRVCEFLFVLFPKQFQMR